MKTVHTGIGAATRSTARAPHYAIVLLVALAVHVATWLIFNSDISNDEVRYLGQAERLINGEDLYARGRVVNPPLLPLLLAGAKLLGVADNLLPLFSIAAIATATLLLLWLVSQYLSVWWSVAVSLVLPLHPAIVMMGAEVMSEPWCILLAMLSAVLMHRIFQRGSASMLQILTVALLFASLAMMKPLFGYTIMAALFFSLLLAWLLQETHRKLMLQMSGVCVLALVFCAPFLTFMYYQTGSVFKWSTGTGAHLYFMSMGGEDIWGSWVPESDMNNYAYLVDQGFAEEVNAIAKLDYQKKDQILQKIAIERIANDPAVFMRNIIANVGRTLFNYPFSFRAQSLFTYGFIVPQMLLFFATVLAVSFVRYTRHYLPPAHVWLLGFYLIYLGGNMLVGSTGRQSLLLVGPLLWGLVIQVRILLDLGFLIPDALNASLSRFDRQRR